MNPICKKCGSSVKNKEQYALFEGMHWLCFHLSFEHGDYDVDEPCEDPSCLWNRANINTLEDNPDAKLASEHSKALLTLKVKEIETKHLPSKLLSIFYRDENAQYQRDAWVADDDILNFVIALDVLLADEGEDCAFETMSPKNFSIQLSKINLKGYFKVELSIEKEHPDLEYPSHSFCRVDFAVNTMELIQFNESLKQMIPPVNG